MPPNPVSAIAFDQLIQKYLSYPESGTIKQNAIKERIKKRKK
jgi:hypothetical protein